MKAMMLLQRTGRLLALATGIAALATAGFLAFASSAHARPVAPITDVACDVRNDPLPPAALRTPHWSKARAR